MIALKIFYVTGVVVMFFWLKTHQDFKERTWTNVFIRLFFAITFPVSFQFIITTYDFPDFEPKTPKFKPPKWL